jgi:hypothetical protein
MNKNKTLIFAIIGVLLASTFTVAVNFAQAIPTNTVNTVANRLLSGSWIRINGVISEWGTTDVRGQLQTQARERTHMLSDTNQLTSATAIWTTNITREISAVQAKENFTYVYYVARLPNASISTASVISAAEYALTGTWNLANVTSTITVLTDENGVITQVHRDQTVKPGKAIGDLTISGNQFTLTINGRETLTGLVYRSIARTWTNPFKMTDDTTSNIVTRSDVKVVAHCYGAMPGWGSYDTRMDFNNNYRVDIADISTVAAKM